MSVAPVQAAAPLAERLSSLVEEWAQRCLDAGKPPSEVLTDDDMAATDVDAARWFLRVGAIFEVNKRLGAMRLSGADASSDGARRNPMHAAQGRNPTVWRALGIALVAADGALKPLLAFGAADLEHLSTQAGAMRLAWARRLEWSKAALVAVKKHRREVVGELPAEVLADLDAKALEAWS